MSPALIPDLSPEVKRALKFRLLNPGRYLADLAHSGIALRGRGTAERPLRALFVSDGLVYTSEEQFAPFELERDRLRDEVGLIAVHLLVDDALRVGTPLLSRFDLVFLKLDFRTPVARVLSTVRRVSEARGLAKLVYMDGDDDSAVQWPGVLRYVDLYVKKHMFRDRSTYQRAFVGKSNLTDFVHRRYGFSFEHDPIPRSVPVPRHQMDKLTLGYNLALDEKIAGLYPGLYQRGEQRDRPNDIVCRATVDEKSWLFHLRKPVLDALANAPQDLKVLAPTWRVPQEEYYREMLSSKICISPFGYGEICWRDFEAIFSGCLVVKPDMSHIETDPDVFVAGETYVPVRWDYSDLLEKCRYYLQHEEERQGIVDNARRVVAEFYERHGFVDKVRGFLTALGLR